MAGRSSILGALMLAATVSAHAQALDATDLVVEAPIRHERLTIFPVSFARLPQASVQFILLDEGLEAGTVVITEIGGEPQADPELQSNQEQRQTGEAQTNVSEERVQQVQQVQRNLVQAIGGGAQVNTLVIRNDSNRPLYLLAGEIIRGAKQDRMIAHDVVIPPGSQDVPLDVFCVESGRWVHESPSFSTAKAIAGVQVRSTAQVDKAQQSVWEQVSAYNKAVGAKTDTDTLRAAFEQEDVQQAMIDYREALIPGLAAVPDLAGVVVAIDGHIVVGDIFGVPGLFDRLRDKLISGYVLDALSAGEADTVPLTRQEAEDYLKRVLAAHGAIDTQDDQTVIRAFAEDGVRGARASYRGAEIHINSFR